MEIMKKCPLCTSTNIAPPTDEAPWYLCLKCNWKSGKKSDTETRVLEEFFLKFIKQSQLTPTPTHLSRRSFFEQQVQEALDKQDYAALLQYAAALAATRNINIFKVLERGFDVATH